MTRFLALLWLALLALAGPAYAQNLPARPQTPVLDEAHVLGPEQVSLIESKARNVYSTSGRTFFVAIVGSLQGLTIEDYGNRLIRTWKVGDEKRDDGVLLIVAPNERQVRIETGYGAEGFLPDILAGRIIRDTITPQFKAGDMGAGVVAGADAILEQMNSSPAEAGRAVAEARATEQQRQRSSGNPLPLVFWALIAGFVLLSMFRRSNGRRYRRRRSGGINPWVVLWGLNELSRSSRRGGGWGGGWGGGGGWSGGGGWGGGGGGSFGGFGGSGGGGGASGSW